MSPVQVSTDVLIFGGGIAGLWSLLRLRQQGYSALLLESRALGGVQTIASQGIIHGGTKYALGGNLSDSSQAIGAMPGRWRACLAGEGEIDLRQARCLADHQYLWSTGQLFARLSGFFAGKLMRSRMQAIEPAQGPALFHHRDFRGELYRLEEPVLDVPSLIDTLAQQSAGYCHALDDPDWAPLPDQGGIRWGSQLEIRAKRLLLAAGEGNRELLARFGLHQPAMQLRPLQMLMARGDLPMLYAHCLGASANPRLTISSHRDADGQSIWYIGGEPAEWGPGQPLQALVERVRAELAEVLPWLPTDRLQWASATLNRAEPAQPAGKRPAHCFVRANGHIITLWPTKLAFAPQLADELLALLQRDGLLPSGKETLPLPLPTARPPVTPWDNAQWH
jgi:glycine/D-amino acid oxidase-like deaminating enzyme